MSMARRRTPRIPELPEFDPSPFLVAAIARSFKVFRTFEPGNRVQGSLALLSRVLREVPDGTQRRALIDYCLQYLTDLRSRENASDALALLGSGPRSEP